jgi:muramoyltetrapeptide carboxypeptidase
MIQPPALQPGNVVGIVAPGRKIDAAAISASVSLLESKGFSVTLGSNIFSENHSYLSGLDNERVADLQQMLDDPTIHAILCARGGYGTTRILDQLDFTAFTKKPKWICGFSDITALHLRLQWLGVQSIHATMPVLFPKRESQSSIESLMNALSGDPETIAAPGHPRNRTGESSGEVFGGNLSLLVDSFGTPTEFDTAGKILVIEEIDEYLYRIDRMLVQLKRAGKLNNLAGLVVGHMTDLKETELPFNETIDHIILQHISEYHFPVGFNFPIGHENPNLAFIEGKKYKLVVNSNGAALHPA